MVKYVPAVLLARRVFHELLVLWAEFFFLVVKLVRVAVECFDELLGFVNGVVGSGCNPLPPTPTIPPPPTPTHPHCTVIECVVSCELVMMKRCLMSSDVN